MLNRLLIAFISTLLLTACSQAEPEVIPEEEVLLAPCTQRPDPGVCKAHFERFYFDQDTEQCEVFVYGGCGGVVPFETLNDCQLNCEAKPQVSVNGCEFEGATYQIGDSFPLECNTCACQDTPDGPQILCTEMACGANTQPEGEFDEHSEVFQGA